MSEMPGGGCDAGGGPGVDGWMRFPEPHVIIVATGPLSTVDCVTMQLESLGYEEVNTRQTEDGFRVVGNRDARVENCRRPGGSPAPHGSEDHHPEPSDP